MPTCKTCSDTPDAEGPWLCPACCRCSANGRYIDDDVAWQRSCGGMALALQFEPEASRPWSLAKCALVGFVASVLMLLGAYAASAQTRQCVEHGYRQVCSQQWPYDRCWRQRYCMRHAYVDSYRRHYRQTEDEERSWNRRDPSEERGVACLSQEVRVVGPARLNEKTAMEAAVRAWQSTVAYDSGEKYMEISDARSYRWRCNRASSNESVIGKAGEAVFGDSAVQKKCVAIARPCLPPMKEGDKDER